MDDISQLNDLTDAIIGNAEPSDEQFYGESFGRSKPKRKSKAKIAPIEPEVVNDENPNSNKEIPYAQMGFIISESFFQVCTIIGGPDWKPEAQEKEAMQSAWSQYLESKQITDIPPEYVLLMVVGSYSVKRVMMPATQSRMRTFWNKIRGKGQNTYDARSNLWNDNKRENYSSNSTS